MYIRMEDQFEEYEYSSDSISREDSFSASDYETCEEDHDYSERDACFGLTDYTKINTLERDLDIHLYDETTTNIFSGNSRRNNNTAAEKTIKDVLTQLQLNSHDEYRKCLQSGVERQRKINIFIVGKKSSGKSSLTRRLLKEPTSDVCSTNGMDVHVLKCKAKLDNGKWIASKGHTGDQEIKSRLLKSLVRSATITKDLDKDQSQDKNVQLSNPEQTKSQESHNSDTDFIELFDFSCLPDATLNDIDTVPIEVWDFAGDKESYHAHVPFFRNEAVYVLTTNIMENIIRRPEYDLDFWLEVIRCHCKKQSNNENDNPPVVIVGTHLDQYQGSPEDAKRNLKSKVNTVLRNSVTTRHIREFYVISNTNGTDESFDHLRKDIIGISQNMPCWNTPKPLHWIQLENALSKEVQFGTFVVSKTKVQEIALRMIQPIKDEKEVDDFLSYHNEIGTLLYFSDLPDVIVLSAKWLADALKCIITADQFQTGIQTLSEFEHFRETGQLTDKLMDEIFRRQPEDISCHKNHILTIMEKFNIIVRPKILEPKEDVNQEGDYVVPSMIRNLALSTIDEMFYADPSKTSCLCFEFEFLPPALFCQYLVTCAQHFTVAIGPMKAESRRPFFYRDTGMFNIDKTGCTKLMVAHYRNVIQNQIWRWGSGQQQNFSFLDLELVKIMENLIEGNNISFRKKFKCKGTDYENVNGMVGSKVIKEKTQYFCEEHGNSHNSEEIFADWFPSENRDGFSKEQQFAAILAIIIVDILTDVLYDRLTMDAPSVKPRSECDITYLYAKLRSATKHVPSKGRWGGGWSDLQHNANKIGDDIERIRLTRNDMQHQSNFSINKGDYRKKIELLRQVVQRMENHNGKSSCYSDRMNDVTKRKLNIREVEDNRKKLLNELPRLKLKPSFHVNAGKGCTIECKIIAPIPEGAEVKWVKIKDKEEIEIKVDESTKSKYSGAEVNYPYLNILSTTKEDEGYYSCRISYPVDCAEKDGCDIDWPKTFLHVHSD